MQKIWTGMFTEALFIIAKKQKLIEHPSRMRDKIWPPPQKGKPTAACHVRDDTENILRKLKKPVTEDQMFQSPFT